MANTFLANIFLNTFFVELILVAGATPLLLLLSFSCTSVDIFVRNWFSSTTLASPSIYALGFESLRVLLGCCCNFHFVLFYF